jgi:hypothetical protein
MRRFGPILLTALLLCAAGCGGDEAEPLANDAQRQSQRIQNMADAMQREAESNVSAIEQGLENETATIFESRNELLNQTAADADSAGSNQSR